MSLSSSIVRSERQDHQEPSQQSIGSIEPTELAAARAATRQLEAGDPLCALTILREVRLRRSTSPESPGVITPIRRLRSYLDQAIFEIEIAHPGHALRTLRIGLGRSPLG